MKKVPDVENMTKKNSTQIDEKNGQPKNKNQALVYCMIFVVGFVAGVAFTVYRGTTLNQAVISQSTGQDQSHTHNEDLQQAITKLEAEVTADPQNFQAWTNLGNLYYDTDQPAKAIVAYNKSLDLHKGDPNLLTDLGVMYKKTAQPQKALELFDRAIRENPTHLPSRYNKGIVMMYDLNDPQGAIATWEDLLRINPEAKTANGEAIKELVAQVKAEQAKKQ